MYTTCSQLLCGKIFLDFPAAWDIHNKPMCANCYNEMVKRHSEALARPLTDNDMRKAIDALLGKRPPSGFTPPTSG